MKFVIEDDIYRKRNDDTYSVT